MDMGEAMVRAGFLSTVLILAGCTTLAPNAAQVVVTRDPLAVRNCQVVGSITVAMNDTREAQNQGAALGADTVLITTSRWVGLSLLGGYSAPTQGTAYRCERK